MNDRRNVLAALAAGTVALPVALARSRSALHPVPDAPVSSPPGQGPPTSPATAPHVETAGASGDYFPNVPVLTHRSEPALFYSDLLRDKLVLLHFMSVTGDARYPVMANMARVQALLGERLGREVFMYSITVDPEHDSPEALARLAKQHGVGRGWSLLTGEPTALELIRGRLFVERRGKHADATGEHARRDCSHGLARYGNEVAGLWGAVAAQSDPRQIVQRLDWIAPRPVRQTAPRRAGPAPLTQALPPTLSSSGDESVLVAGPDEAQSK